MNTILLLNLRKDLVRRNKNIPSQTFVSIEAVKLRLKKMARGKSLAPAKQCLLESKLVRKIIYDNYKGVNQYRKYRELRGIIKALTIPQQQSRLDNDLEVDKLEQNQ